LDNLLEVQLVIERSGKENDFVSGMQSQILEIIKENPQVTYRYMATKLNVSNRTITLNMKKLQEIKIIHREGSSQKGRWIMDNSSAR